MKALILPAFAALALVLAGCETATPYQPISAHNSQASGGYADQQIEANRWRVTFSGNDLTARDTVERYLLYRAAELTLAQGNDWFATTDRETDKKSTYTTDGFYGGWGGYWGPRWGFYRRGYGWGPYCHWGDPFCGGPGGWDVSESRRYQASAEVVMGKGPKPADRGAFDARSVIEHLGPTIQRPTAGR